MTPKVFISRDDWRKLGRAELEKQYSPSSCVEDMDILVAAYSSGSQRAEAAATVQKNLKYGEGPGERLDYFPANNNRAPLQVFIHGGYWQELSKNESTFAGADFVGNGVAFAAIDYTLAPGGTISQMIDQCRRSIAWLHEHAARLGFDRDRLYVSGSSAGAHLAAMVLLSDWPSYGLPADAIKGGVLVSGIYDLRPICHTYINEPLQLDETEARRLSPILSDLGARPPVLVCWGENETAEFKRQSESFAGAWGKAGNEVRQLEIPGRNHFDVILGLGKPDDPLGSRVLLQMAE